MDLLGITANVAAVVDLLIKAGVMCSIYCRDVKNATRDVRLILTEADKMTATLKDVERLVSGPTRAKFEDSLGLHSSVAGCRVELTGLVAKLEAGTRQKGLVWPFKKHEIAEIVKRLERSRSIMGLDLSVKQTDFLLSIRQEMALSKLRVAEGATYNSYVDAYGERCHPGTRLGILKQIRQWSGDPTSSCVFWLNGMAGTGKSTIARTVSQSFADEGKLGASFFFKRGEGDRGSAAFVFTTIAFQLARTVPSIAPHICDALEADPVINEKSAEKQFDALIVGPMTKLSIHSLPSLVVVFDALDECDSQESVRTLIRLASEAETSTSGRLKFFLTSRPELPIRLGFSDIGDNYEDAILHLISPSTIAGDISECLRDRLTIIRNDYNNSVMESRKLPSDWPGENNIQRLIDMAIPLFIFVATTCRFLEDRRLGGPKDQLVSVLEYHKTQISRMDTVYLPVLDRLLKGLSAVERDEVMQKFKTIVGSIVVLANPLSISSLSQLLGTSTDTIENQLDFLHSVLRVPSDLETPVRLLHLSFRGFLTDVAKSNDAEKYPFWVDERAAHTLLGDRCLRLLSTSNRMRNDICYMKMPGAQRDDISQALIDEHLPPAIRYACRYWVYHVKLSGIRIVDGDAVSSFLVRHLLHWLEALGILGRIWESIDIVEDLLSILEPESSHKAFLLLQDIRRILLNNCAMLDSTPLQIYSSALVFAPETSVVRVTFRQEIPPWLHSLPKVDQGWDACLAVLNEPGERLKSVVFSPDSSKIVSVCEYGSINIWDVTFGNFVVTCQGPNYPTPIESMAISADGQSVLVSSARGTTETWDIKTGDLRRTVTIPMSKADQVCKLSEDGTTLLLALHEGSLVLYDTNTGELAAKYSCSGYCQLTAVSSDHVNLLSVSDDNTVRIWEMATQVCTTTYKYASSKARPEAVSPSGERIAWKVQKKIEISDAATGICTATCEGHENNIDKVLFAPNNVIAVSASNDSIIKIWDAVTGACLSTCHGHGGAVKSFNFTSDSDRFVSTSADKTLKVWDTATGGHLATFTGHTQWVTNAIFSPDDTMVASVSVDGTARIWEMTSCESPCEQPKFIGRITKVTFSPDHRRLASLSTDGDLKIWDTATAGCIVVHEGHTDLIMPRLALAPHLMNEPVDCLEIEGQNDASLRDRAQPVVFSPDGKKLASMKNGWTLTIIDTETGNYLGTQEYTTDFVQLLFFSADSTRLLSVTYHAGVTVWDVTGSACRLIADVEGHQHDMLGCAAISADSSKLLVTSTRHGNDAQTKIWDLTSLSETTLKLGDSVPEWMSFSADSSKLTLTLMDRTMQIWDIKEETIMSSSQHVVGEIIFTAFSPDAVSLVSIATNGFLKLWDTKTGHCVWRVQVGEFVGRAAFDTSGCLLKTAMGMFTLDNEWSLEHDPDLDQMVNVTTQDVSSTRVFQQGIGISVCGQWVTWKSQKVLWLPPAYRPGVSDTSMSMVAIGSSSGRFIMLSIQATGDLA